MGIFQIRFQKKVTANQIKGGPFWPPLRAAGVNDIILTYEKLQNYSRNHNQERLFSVIYQRVTVMNKSFL